MPIFKKPQGKGPKNNTEKEEAKKPEINLPEGVKKVEVKINPKKVLTGILGIFLVVWFFIALSGWAKSNLEIPLSQAIADIREGKVKSVEVVGNQISLIYNDGK